MVEFGFAARHGVLARGYGGGDEPESIVRAMQVVLHIPKLDPPARSALLVAAASACVALCLDERVGPGGEWEQPYLAWHGSRIRKVARRARGAAWMAAQQVDGVSVEHAGAQVRACVPGPVSELDPRIKRLQVGGTDLAADDPGPPDPSLPVFWVNSALRMTVGKAAAQVGHASMLLAGALGVDETSRWAQREFRCAVVDADAAQWTELSALAAAGRAVAVRDAGFTEVAPGSITVIGVAAG